MRVTKLIREYVEEQVTKNFPQSQAEIKFDEICKKVNEKRTELNIKLKEIAKELCEQANKELGLNDLKSGQGLYINDYWNGVFSTLYDTKIYEEAQIQKQKRLEKINNTINDILISLELGANRQELEEMLNNIGVNQNEDKI